MSQSKFLDNFKNALELPHEKLVTLDDTFKDLDEWDSLAALSLVAMLDEEYEVGLESEDLDQFMTVEDLYLFVKSKL